MASVKATCRAMLKPENIPPQLADLKCWLMWTAGPLNLETGKFEKFPKYATNGKARSGTQGAAEDVANLVTLKEALAAFNASKQYAGIGIACLPQFNLTVYDGDKCVKDGVIDPARAELTDMTYTELSPSKTGIRAIWIGQSESQKNTPQGHELFHNTGFVTITGNKVPTSWDLFCAPVLPLLPDAKRDELLALTDTTRAKPKHDALGLTLPSPEQVQELRSALNYLKADDRDLWIAVGQSLKSAGDVGFELWATWSQRSAHYQEGDLDKWDTFSADRTSWQSVFKKAQAAGWTNPAQKHFSEWPEPMDAFAESPVPSLPMHALPAPIREYAIAQSVMSGIDAGAYAFTTLMATMALIDQRAKIIASDGWDAPPVFWSALVDASGGGKSPVLRAGQKFLQVAHQNIVQASIEAKQQWEAVKSFTKRGDSIPAAPPWHQLTATDSTIEGLTALLENNPRGLVVVVEELTELIGRMDAYGGKGGDKDRGAYLSMYDGGPRMVNRAGGNNKYIPNMSASIITAVQPTKLASLYMKSGGQGSDGLYQRFLCYVMQPRTALKLGGVMDSAVTAGIAALSAQVEQWSLDGVFVNQPCRLSREAAAQFEAFANDFIFIAQRTDTDRFREHLNKFPGFLLRLCFGLHAIECAQAGTWSQSVTGEAMARAREIISALYFHSQAVYATLEKDTGSVALVQAVASIILARGWEAFTWGDLTRECAQFKAQPDARVAEAMLDRLIAMGWIDDVTEVKPGRGRPAKGRFAVNPAVHTKFKDAADKQKTARLERGQAFDRVTGRLKGY